MSLFSSDMSNLELHLLIEDMPLPDPVLVMIRVIMVEYQLNLPSVCEVEIVDPNLDSLELLGLVPGAFISVRGVSGDDPIGIAIFAGQVETIEVRFDSVIGLRSVVRAFDSGHRLLHGNKTLGFPFMTYSEVAALVAAEHDLIPIMVPHPIVHTIVVQSNETDWDFLVRLGREIGYVLLTKINPITGMPSLYFGPPAPEGAVLIGIGDEQIISLRASVSGSGLTPIASTRGWDQNLGAPAVGVGETADDTSLNAFPAAELGLEFGGAGQVVSLERLAENEAATEAASEGLGMRLAGAYANIEGELRGNPMITPNVAISLVNAGMLTGEYIVTTATHTFLPQVNGYRTTFVCSGHEDRTMMGLQDAARSDVKLNGVFSAIVTDVEDPEMMGRVLLSFPWLSDAFVSNWARVVQAGAGPMTGMQILPEPLDEVLVAFENGQLDSPYVLGGLYSADRRGAIPANQLVQGVTMKRAFTSRDGHQVIFDDSPETTSLVLNTTFGASCLIRMSPETGIIITTVEDQPIIINGASDVTINSEGVVTINAGDLVINGEADVSISAEGAIEITAAEELNLAAASITVEAEEISFVAGIVNITGGIVNLGA